MKMTKLSWYFGMAFLIYRGMLDLKRVLAFCGKMDFSQIRRVGAWLHYLEKQKFTFTVVTLQINK